MYQAKQWMALAYKERTQKDLGGILYYPVNQKRKEQLPAHERLQCAELNSSSYGCFSSINCQNPFSFK